MQSPHTHPCPDCKKPVPCAGEWEQNHDGLSGQFCPVYERFREPVCEDCREWRDKVTTARTRVEQD